ncbi:hypothetical protein ABT124_05570 [Streptomyces sp. NPDC001982]|uniref:hypothetical protein n=1 Tax=unclassified Streptomyces TaxID=2593676 RepID=UPI003321E0BD
MAALLGTVAEALLLSGCAAVDLPLAGVRVGADGAPYAPGPAGTTRTRDWPSTAAPGA